MLWWIGQYRNCAAESADRDCLFARYTIDPLWKNTSHMWYTSIDGLEGQNTCSGGGTRTPNLVANPATAGLCHGATRPLLHKDTADTRAALMRF